MPRRSEAPAIRASATQSHSLMARNSARMFLTKALHAIRCPCLVLGSETNKVFAHKTERRLVVTSISFPLWVGNRFEQRVMEQLISWLSTGSECII